MKEKTRRIDADANRESDGVVVPEKSPNNEAPASAEEMEGRTSAKRNAGDETTSRIQCREMVSFGLEGVRTLYSPVASYHTRAAPAKLL